LIHFQSQQAKSGGAEVSRAARLLFEYAKVVMSIIQVYQNIQLAANLSTQNVLDLSWTARLLLYMLYGIDASVRAAL
jgi:hypothetical protein